ncbi:PRC-barrel domain-containing protein [Cellvibrio sp.]|uniref:PRC-barrel domain-containing protein n=1 Tax=Cellvibrio sp. TaxID=1965322 RepID=UPI0039647807
MSHITSENYAGAAYEYAGNYHCDLVGTDTLIGKDVYNYDDEHVGDVKEIILNNFTGEIAYVVLSFGGIFGVGEKLFAVPWKALTLNTRNGTLILNECKERLERAPGFDKNCWPNMEEKNWINKIHTFYQTRVYSFEQEF